MKRPNFLTLSLALVGMASVRLSVSEPSCFIPGECQHSTFLDESITLGENSCLHFCQGIEGCQWFTYHSEDSLCVATADCHKVDRTRNAISGMSNCSDLDNQCWVKGICKGTLLTKVSASTSEECRGQCLDSSECSWFTFDAFPKACFLFENCPTIDTSRTSCISSSSKCKAMTSYTKLLVAGSKQVEVIDLGSSTSVCSNITNLPQLVHSQLGGVNANLNPFLCGGLYMEKDCFTLNQGQWEAYFPLNDARAQSAITEFPFALDHSVTHFITGGFYVNESLPSTEVLNPNGWSFKVPDLPIPIYDHCMVLINSTTVMITGGFHDLATVSVDTFIMNSIQGGWIPGPSLAAPRARHACARIRKNLESTEFKVIVVGGYPPSFLPPYISSVELLNEETSRWEYGPELPFPMTDLRLVEDPAGGVILVGGYVGEPIDTLYRLSHAEATEWKLMPQRLNVARKFTAAFMIPDGIVDCAVPNDSN